MTTSSQSAVLAQTTVAQMNAWVGELYTNWVTDCGLVQTNDTGQLTVSGGNANIAALPTSTGVANAVGYFLFTFNDSLAPGTLATTALNSGGTGYTNGASQAVAIVGATSGATANAVVTVTGGVCGNLGTFTTVGNFIAGEKITVTSGLSGGSGANWTAASLSSGNPIIFRLDFGGGTATTDPQVWITVGAGTNGAGTIAGTAGTSKMTQVACFNGTAPASTSTAYTSRYVYNSSLAYLGTVFKIGAAAANCAAGSIIIFRTSNTAGSPSNNAALLITNASSTTGASNTEVGCMQCMTWSGGAGSTVYPTAINAANCSTWGSVGSTNSVTFPFGLTATLENSIAFVFPIYTMDPGLKFSAFNGIASITDFPLGNTASYAMVGSTALTFISCGLCFGASTGFAGNGNTNYTFCMLWQ
jgi:hypothetical protein